VSPSDAEGVRRAAREVGDRAALPARARTCTACPELAATRTQVVPGVLPPGARLLVLGEAPGAAEDIAGTPFVGRSGQLLDELLAAVGVARSQVAVLNTVQCRPPGNRPPTRAETATCRPWATRQLELAAPEVVVALGLSATRWFLGPTTLTAVRAGPRGGARRRRQGARAAARPAGGSRRRSGRGPPRSAALGW